MGLLEEQKTPELFAERFRGRMAELDPEERKQKLTAKQREARDPLIRKRQVQSLWDKLMLEEKRLHARNRYKKFWSRQDRDLLEAVTKSKERLNPFVIGGVVQPGMDLPEIEDLPYVRITGEGRGPARRGGGHADRRHGSGFP